MKVLVRGRHHRRGRGAQSPGREGNDRMSQRLTAAAAQLERIPGSAKLADDIRAIAEAKTDGELNEALSRTHTLAVDNDWETCP